MRLETEYPSKHLPLKGGGIFLQQYCIRGVSPMSVTPLAPAHLSPTRFDATHRDGLNADGEEYPIHDDEGMASVAAREHGESNDDAYCF